MRTMPAGRHVTYKVEMRYSYGWDDAGWCDEGKPWRFATKEEAQEEINDLCRYMNAGKGAAELRAGDRYDPADYRVVEA